MSRAPLDAEQLAVRDLARQAAPIDRMARTLVAGYSIGVPCPGCDGTGRIACKDSRHVAWTSRGNYLHDCNERECDACKERRHTVFLASVEAQRIRGEELDEHGWPLRRTICERVVTANMPRPPGRSRS